MITENKLKIYTTKDIDNIPQLNILTNQQKFDIKVVASVFPFRTNNYVVEELIDWTKVPNDPIFQLTFLQKNMLSNYQFEQLAEVIRKGVTKEELSIVVDEIREELNPHPAGQMTANVPFLDEEPVEGIQHKYKETVLVFPTGGQTCHAYCTFCFRWAQFIGDNDLKFATDESKKFQDYIIKHKEITDILFTGGDPMVMSYKKLKAYLEPLLEPQFDHIKNIRIGTKSLSYWPYRFVTDKDSGLIIELFDKIMSSGKHLAIMAHFSHPVELETNIVKRAIRRLRKIGVKIRTQSPVIKHVNNDSNIWAKMWQQQVNLGLIPYYMFVERNTGAKGYFEIPLYQVFEIYKNAFKRVSGLNRTARGPVMSASPGKVSIDGIAKISGEKVFVLSLLQARNPEWVKKPFFAKYNENATWFSDLEPAFGEDKFFFEEELNKMLNKKEKMFDKLAG
ncbi:MAG: lysine 2,3-aminomutase [Melioribacteraceae bacterium]|nr:lysine 2,3-aminomutase [Melioribacteraceae bacterium]